MGLLNPDNDKYSTSRFGISFDGCAIFLLPNGGFGKNVILFGADMSSPVDVYNKKWYPNFL